MSPGLLALFGIGAAVNAYATAQQIASQSKLLQLQAGMLRENAKDNYGLAKEQSILFTRTAEENARKVLEVGQDQMMREKIAGKARIGGIRAKLGSSGAIADVGTGGQLQIGQALANSYNQRMIKHNTNYEAARTRLEGRQRATMTMRAAENAAIAASRQAAYLETQAAEVRATKSLAVLSSLLGGMSNIVKSMPVQEPMSTPVDNPVQTFYRTEFGRNYTPTDYNLLMKDRPYAY